MKKGRRKGRFTKEMFLDKTKHPRWRGGENTYTCEFCSKKFKRHKSKQKDRKYIYCSYECFKKIRKIDKSKAPGWRGGVSQLEASINSFKRKLIIALAIYNVECQKCNDKDIIVLQWHHRKGRGNHRLDDCRKIVIKIVKANKILEEYMLLCANCHIHQDLEDETSKRGTRMKEVSIASIQMSRK